MMQIKGKKSPWIAARSCCSIGCGIRGITPIPPSSFGTWIPKSGPTSPLKNEDFQIEALGRWKAPGGKTYPSGWKISVPRLELEGVVKPLVLDQELRLRRIGNLRYWEGACTFHGTRNGKSLSGRGYTELTGYATPIGQGMKE